MEMIPKQIKKIYPVLFLLLLIGVGTLIRIQAFSPLWSNDGNRDYLVAHHIVQFHEFPLRGPINQSLSHIFGESNISSPLYFYFCAFFLFILDTPQTLGIVNIIIQVLTIYIVYLLAKRIGNIQTGLLSAGLFSLSKIIVIQSADIFQPWVMQFFITLCYFFLITSYQKKSVWWLGIGSVFFVIAGTLHNSAFGLFPLFIGVVGTILYKIKATKSQYSGIAILTGISVLLLYFPILIHPYPVSRSIQFFSFSLSEFVIVLKDYFVSFFGYFFPRTHYGFFAIFFIVASIFYCIFQKDSLKRTYIVLSLASLFSLLGWAYILHFEISDMHRNFTPVYPLFIISCVLFIQFFFSKISYRLPFQSITVFMLLFFFTDRFTLKINFDDQIRAQGTVKALHKEIVRIKNNQSFDNYRFFDIKTCIHPALFVQNARLWVALEKGLHTRLVTVSDTDFRNITPEKSPEYVFFVIEDSTPEHCMTEFQKQNSPYVLVRSIEEIPIIQVYVKAGTK